MKFNNPICSFALWLGILSGRFNSGMKERVQRTMASNGAQQQGLVLRGMLGRAEV